VSDDDPVQRNRATPRRHVPGRAPTGAGVTRILGLATVAVVVIVTVLLVAVVALGR
jgi:hypothetical protein